jgi:hypothetical protein
MKDYKKLKVSDNSKGFFIKNLGDAIMTVLIIILFVSVLLIAPHIAELIIQ